MSGPFETACAFQFPLGAVDRSSFQILRQNAHLFSAILTGAWISCRGAWRAVNTAMLFLAIWFDTIRKPLRGSEQVGSIPLTIGDRDIPRAGLQFCFSLGSSLLVQSLFAVFLLILPMRMPVTTMAPRYALVSTTSLKPIIYLRRDKAKILQRVPKGVGKRPFVTISAPKLPMRLAREGFQQPVIEGNPLPLFSNSAAPLNSGVTVPSVPPPVRSIVRIQIGSFFDRDLNLRSPGEGPRKGKRGVYESGFDGSGEPLTTPVRIISKPTPIYSEEGLRLKIQGDVVVLVEFRADGVARAARIVEGLGHGLDEAAVFAVERIRFKPATINGRLTNFEARAHVEFTLDPTNPDCQLQYAKSLSVKSFAAIAPCSSDEGRFSYSSIKMR